MVQPRRQYRYFDAPKLTIRDGGFTKHPPLKSFDGMCTSGNSLLRSNFESLCHGSGKTSRIDVIGSVGVAGASAANRAPGQCWFDLVLNPVINRGVSHLPTCLRIAVDQ